MPAGMSRAAQSVPQLLSVTGRTAHRPARKTLHERTVALQEAKRLQSSNEERRGSSSGQSVGSSSTGSSGNRGGRARPRRSSRDGADSRQEDSLWSDRSDAEVEVLFRSISPQPCAERAHASTAVRMGGEMPCSVLSQHPLAVSSVLSQAPPIAVFAESLQRMPSQSMASVAVAVAKRSSECSDDSIQCSVEPAEIDSIEIEVVL